MPAPVRFDSLDDAVASLLASIDGPLRVGAPLGIGKPHRFLNALYARVVGDASRPLTLYTALSLDPPSGSSELERRFLGPLVSRLYGDPASGNAFPRLAYVEAMKRDALPAHVEVEEFYFQSGALLGSTQAQRRYASLNYTHVARAMADRGMNVLVQKVAAGEDGGRLSLSSNTDLTFDAIDAIVARGLPRPILVAEIDPQLPWLDGTAAVNADFFDMVVLPPPLGTGANLDGYPPLFAVPRQPVGEIDYAIGFYASALVRDGGTLQIGIGTLADALAYALALRHTDNAAYRRVLQALDPELERHPTVLASGGLDPFAQGLYGCSEMINEGFRLLVDAGVIRRKVVDNEALMQRLNAGTADLSDRKLVERDGEFLHGAFYLGSPAFYDWLRGLDAKTRRAIGMKRVSEVNELYGGNETLERLQRRDARFFNSCMMATALGAAVSDALEDGRVVSGVGGQYNFVAMAHALPDARSALLLRATREERGRAASNVRWAYGHCTIPRHLRDVYVTEYGIADLRGRTDEDCVVGMAGIADTRFQRGLLERARAHGKLRRDFTPPARWKRNDRDLLHRALAPLRADGTLPDYPLGSDFTEVEQRLVKALSWLKSNTSTPWTRTAALLRAAFVGRTPDRDALQRLGLAEPQGARERLLARLVGYALERMRRAEPA